MDFGDLTMDIAQEITIKAAQGDVFRSLLRNLSNDNTTPDGKSMSLVLEPWPGGRWFRDLGDQQGHLWGFVQVFKPPTLLEVTGPMMMSYPATNHIQFRLTPVSGGTSLALRHRALGLIDAQHRSGVGTGWAHILKSTKESAEK
jgi:Activator of Hsp90 ATPase homolog 1-like protein